ncbi:MAG TPA: Gfo/Idh/MocA family oxidoreductase [Phycisphaeraceae bacterium]
MVRIAILGMGFMGCTHYQAYRKAPGAQVTVIADRNPKRAQGDLSGVWGNLGEGMPRQLPMDGLRGTTDLRAPLTMDDVDVIDICLATPLHVEFAVAALEAGKHVICEKPLAASTAQAHPILEAAAKAKGFFMPAMCMRFWPGWSWLKEAVRDGRWGRVLSASFSRLASMPPGWFRQGDLSGGAAMDLHIHDTDFVHYLFGTPRAVTSRGYRRLSGRVDHLATLYHYDQVPLVTAEGSWALADGFAFSMRYVVNFEEATAEFDLSRPQPLTVVRNGQAQAEPCPPGDGFEGELAYFVNCVQQNKRPAVVDAAQALESMRIVEAECQSIDTGRTVEL